MASSHPEASIVEPAPTPLAEPPGGVDETIARAEAVAAARPSVAQAATGGLVWMTIASVIAKIVGFGQLIVLAWFLTPDDFGLLTMANTVLAFAVIPLRLGLEEILIQRYRRWHLWSGPAFWISLTSGLGTFAILLLSAPLAARFYDSWRVAGLLVVLGLATPVTALIAVPTARLAAELKFRAVAMVSVAQLLASVAVAVPLAALGFGAMSVAIGGLAAAIVNTGGQWWMAGVGPIGRPRVRRWRYFLRDSGFLQGSRFATAVASNVDFITVGRLAGEAPLGVYSYAYNQSLQAMRLIAANLAGVLFPSLSSFGDDTPRKYAAFLRGMSLVLPLVVPLCLLQAAIADPLFHAMFKPEYWPGIRLFQVLSFGTIGVSAVTLCHSFLLSLRRNDLSFANSGGSAACFCVLVPIGWWLGGVPGVACAVTLTSFASLALAHWLAARGAGSRRRMPSAFIFVRRCWRSPRVRRRRHWPNCSRRPPAAVRPA